LYTLRIEQELNIGRELRLPYTTDARAYGQHWNVFVVIQAEYLNDWGMAVDFSHIRDLIKQHDNQYFFQKSVRGEQELEEFPGGHVHCPFSPTMENMAKFLWEEICLYLAKSPHYKEIKGKVVSVEIRGDGGSVLYEF